MELAAIAPELRQFTDVTLSFLSGGKRFRALFCYWGWQSVTSSVDELDPFAHPSTETVLPGIVLAASALEVFHAAALVHDDIMDSSDTRRGAPSAHRRFESIHREGGFRGDAAAFGRSSALLLGDLLLGWSDELFDRGTSMLVDRAAGAAGRTEFAIMRTEVTAGQYLDILEENAWATYPEAEALPRAHRVIVYKSAKYSVEAPLAIGAALGGASAAQVAALRAFGLPLGVAYQLRDDMLGVFGDPAVTGKPAGDDLVEGKRTVLVAHALEAAATADATHLDSSLGRPLDDAAIAELRRIIHVSGAPAQVEELIDSLADTALVALAGADIDEHARSVLAQLASAATRRTV